MLLIGMAAWVARYILFAYGNNGVLVWMLYLGILLHGICYDFFFVTGQIYVDQKAPPFICVRPRRDSSPSSPTASGMLIGSWISGRVVDAYALPRRSGARLAEHLARAGSDGGRRAHPVRAVLSIDGKSGGGAMTLRKLLAGVVGLCVLPYATHATRAPHDPIYSAVQVQGVPSAPGTFTFRDGRESSVRCDRSRDRRRARHRLARAGRCPLAHRAAGRADQRGCGGHGSLCRDCRRRRVRSAVLSFRGRRRTISESDFPARSHGRHAHLA